MNENENKIWKHTKYEEHPWEIMNLVNTMDIQFASDITGQPILKGENQVKHSTARIKPMRF
jgi:hypothetical protein